MQKKQFGRSMIEMLGVLAIIGVLSIGGLLGYRRAVNNHQANTILDDVNRFAFVILERSGLALGDVVSKGDFKENGIYTLEGYQDIEPEQFSITVFDVPKGVCESLLPKAAVGYVVRINEHGSDEGVLYNSIHQDFCHDSNDIVLYFGDTTDLICGQLPKCTKYSSECKCLECEEDFNLSSDGEWCVSETCKSTGGECTSNEDCCNSTDFCAFDNATGCSDTDATEYVGKLPNMTYGECKKISSFGTGTGDYTKTVTVNGVSMKFIRSEKAMKWWTAQNWCRRFKRLDGTTNMEMPSAADLGCGYFPANNINGDCNDSNASGKEGVVLVALKDRENNNFYWLSDNFGSTSSCYAYAVNVPHSNIGLGNRSNPTGLLTLCQ